MIKPIPNILFISVIMNNCLASPDDLMKILSNVSIIRNTPAAINALK